MTDISETIKAKSDQLNADDLIGGPITVTITDVSLRAGEQPIAINYEGDNGRPYLPCKTMRRVLMAVWGKYADKYIGKRMTLFRDPEVVYGGQQVGGVRISHMSGITTPITLSLTAMRSKKKPVVISPLLETDLKNDGEIQAQQGIDALQEWFKNLSQSQKLEIKPDLERLKEIANKNQPQTEDEEGVM